MTIFQAFLLGIIQGLTEFLPVSSTAHILILQDFLRIQASPATFAFAVLVQLGTLLALGIFYWKDLLQMVRAFIKGLVTRKPVEDPDSRLAWYVGLASIPALAGGYLIGDVDWKDALVIGTFQVLSVFPGASRSGSTITGGMLRGLHRTDAARFAFLMSAPVMLVAGAYQSWELIKMPNTSDMLPLLLTGFIAAAVVGWLALRWLIDYLKDHSLYLFA